MDDLGLKRDEHVLLTTPDVVVKSVPFEAILTDLRIFLVDRKDNLLPTREIFLDSVRHVEHGENAIRDPILTLWVSANNETRQMILTFPQRTGAVRKRDRDEWATRLRNLTASPVQDIIKKVVPSYGKEPKKKIIEHPASGPAPGPATQAPPEEIKFREDLPAGRTADSAGVSPTDREGEPLPYGTFCSKCGNRLSPGSLFCNRCGAKTVVGKAAAPVQEERHDEAPASPKASGPYHEPPYSTGRIGPHRERRGFFSNLFPKKKPRQHVAPVHPPARSGPPAGRSFSGPSKKTLKMVGIVVAAILVIALVGYAALNVLPGIIPGTGGTHGSSTQGGSTTPTPVSTLQYNAISTVTVVHTQTPITIPSEGVSLYINYLGSWGGTYTVNNQTQSLKRSGEYVTTLEDASGTVEASFKKNDGSSHDLVVKIYKDGAELVSKTTTEPNGQVSVSADTGIAPVTATPTATKTATKTPTPTATGTS